MAEEKKTLTVDYSSYIMPSCIPSRFFLTGQLLRAEIVDGYTINYYTFPPILKDANSNLENSTSVLLTNEKKRDILDT